MSEPTKISGAGDIVPLILGTLREAVGAMAGSVAGLVWQYRLWLLGAAVAGLVFAVSYGHARLTSGTRGHL